MPANQTVSPAGIALDCLNSAKFLVFRDCFCIVETATPQVRQALTQMNQDHVQMVNEWFNLMHSRGWYQVAQADTNVITNTINQIQTISGQTGAQAQLGGQTQQYQQPPTR